MRSVNATNTVTEIKPSPVGVGVVGTGKFVDEETRKRLDAEYKRHMSLTHAHDKKPEVSKEVQELRDWVDKKKAERGLV